MSDIPEDEDQPEEFYASRADEILALQYDRDEDAIREEAAIRDDDPFAFD